MPPVRLHTFSPLMVIVLLITLICSYNAHSSPSAPTLLQEQIKADLSEVRAFISTAIAFANHHPNSTLHLTSPEPKAQPLAFIEKLSANNYNESLVVEITFQRSSQNPKISPLLAGKTLQFIGLNKHAQISHTAPTTQTSFSSQHNLSTRPPKKKSSFTQTIASLKKKLQKTHNEKALQRVLQKTQKQLDEEYENTPPYDITQHADKAENVSGLACIRLADQHGQFFAEEASRAGTVDLFARLPAPYNACRKKKT